VIRGIKICNPGDTFRPNKAVVPYRAMRSHLLGSMGLLVLLTLSGAAPKDANEGWIKLFSDEGAPKGFHVTAWDDVSKPPPDGAKWLVKDGILNGSDPRGTWLVSDDLYSDFELELDFKIGIAGNSGVGLRFPDAGDPAFDGMELQIMGPRYRGDDVVPDNEKTGALYQLFAPKIKVLRQDDWNHYWITLRGPHVKIYLNGHLVQDLNLDQQKDAPKRGNPPAQRPRQGHIGFQELSRGGGHVQIRNARLRKLEN
jgi:hypothetical protein